MFQIEQQNYRYFETELITGGANLVKVSCEENCLFLLIGNANDFVLK